MAGDAKPNGGPVAVTLVVAAIAVGCLFALAALEVQSAPSVTAAPGQVVAWAQAHQSAIRISVWASTLLALGLSVVLGIIRGLLPEPNRDVFLLGAAAFVIETAVQGWLWGALALHPTSDGAQTARALLDVASFWGPVLTSATTAMIGAVTALAFRRPSQIPIWLAALGAVAFIEQALETMTVFGTHGFIEPGGAMNLELGGPLTAIWLAALVVWSARRLARTPRI